jgi:hypothetical protein
MPIPSPEKPNFCPVKVWPSDGPLKAKQCSRLVAEGYDGLCRQHRRVLDRYQDLPLMDGGRVWLHADGVRFRAGPFKI